MFAAEHATIEFPERGDLRVHALTFGCPPGRSSPGRGPVVKARGPESSSTTARAHVSVACWTIWMTDRVASCSRPLRANAPSPLPVGCVLVSKSFEDLFAELCHRAATRPEGSGTVRALDAGIHEIGKKVVEEAAEVWMAAEYQDRSAAAEEISQLLYHLQVMMIALGLDLDDVYEYL